MTNENFRDDPLTHDVIGAAIEVHRHFGPGLTEKLYERCLRHELELRQHRVTQQQVVTITYKGFTFEEILKYDLVVDECLLLELKCVETVIPKHKSQTLSYMKLLEIPTGLIINFHEPRLVDGVTRLYLPAN